MQNSPTKTKLLLAGLAFAFATQLADASIPLNDDGSLKFYADFRARIETDFDSTRSDGVNKRTDRTRFRIRGRAGLSYQANDVLSFNGRIRTGDKSSQQSPHITLWQNKGDEGRQSDITADKLFAKLAIGDFSAIAGRNTRSFWQPHEFYFDDDVYMDGISFNYSADGGNLVFNQYAAVLPDGDQAWDRSDRSSIYGGQIKYTHSNDTGKLIVANTLSFILDDEDVVNATNDDIDQTLYMLNVQYAPKNAPVSSVYGADVYYNFEAGPIGDPTRGDQTGYTVYGKWGSANDPGDWQFGYYYAHIEKWAVSRYFAQDDWFRFGSATQTRSSDYEGHEFRAVYKLNKTSNVVARLYIVDTISNAEDGNRFRVDYNTKF